MRKRSVYWNLPKLRQLCRCNGGFGPSTTQNHLRTKQIVSGTRNSSRVAACAQWNETVVTVRETFVRSPQKSTHRASRELQMPHSSVWRILLKRLRAKGYRVQLDWVHFWQWLSSSSLASTVTWPNRLRFFLMGLHQGSCVRAPYATWFTTSATRDRGCSRRYRPWDVATCVAGTWLQDSRLPRHQGGYIEHL
jgi:hypothetical protein